MGSFHPAPTDAGTMGETIGADIPFLAETLNNGLRWALIYPLGSRGLNFEGPLIRGALR